MIVVLTGFYNAEEYILRSLTSIKNQNYKEFTCYITSDHSTDNSVPLIKDFIKDDARFILVEDANKKVYQTGNFDRVIRNNPDIADSDILVEVDGDDYLPDPGTLDRINNTYSDTDVWIANGSFIYSSGAPGFARRQENFDNLRQGRFTASHIRTWRAFLWRAIKEEDLRDENGDYWQWSGDVCFMFPMLEMAGEIHYKFMDFVNYVYNGDNPINEHKVNLRMVNDHAAKIRSKPPYKRIDLHKENNKGLTFLIKE